MPQKQGGHLNIGEVKSSILEFILEQKGAIGEPAIRKYLFEKFDVIDQGNINRHLHYLRKHECIELIPSQKKGLSNHWDIKKLKNLKSIREEFPELQLNKHEKAINIIITELSNDVEYFYGEWLRLHIQLLLSLSFFDTCIEIDSKTLGQRIWKSYTTIKDSFRHERINDLLKICYRAYAKYYSDFKVSEDVFVAIMKKFSVEFITIRTEKAIIEFYKSLPGLPEKMLSRIVKTRFCEPIEEIPDKIPDEIDAKYFEKYMLHALQLIRDQRRDYYSSIYYLLLEHFFIQDVLIGVDSDDEHDFVKKTIENGALFHRWPELFDIDIRLEDAELADLKLVSDIIYKYKQPAQFSDGCNNPDEVKQKVLKYYS
jgi:hypothetical protein